MASLEKIVRDRNARSFAKTNERGPKFFLRISLEAKIKNKFARPCTPNVPKTNGQFADEIIQRNENDLHASCASAENYFAKLRRSKSNSRASRLDLERKCVDESVKGNLMISEGIKVFCRA